MSRMIIIPPKDKGENAKLRVAAYCRVSTNHADQENSYETQVRYFSSLYDYSEAEQLVGIYADEGISGTSLYNRESFGKMMQDCRKGKIDRIVTKSISRFARNTKDCLAAVRELKDLGITVSFEKERIDTARMSDEMMITVMGGLAQEESQSMSKNIRWSLQKRMAKGEMRHARVPYGYKASKKTGALVIDKKKAEIVRRIFDMYINGMGIKAIAVKLNDESIPSPTGTGWNGITVNKMLRQEKYIGDTLWQKTYSEFMGPQFQINRGQQPKYYIKNSHPAIIDRETFELAAKIKKARVPSNVSRIESPFRNKIVCGKCGHAYSLCSGRGKTSWKCSHKYDISYPCDNENVYDKDVQIALEALCDKLRAHGKAILSRCIVQFEMLERMKQNGTVRISSLYQEIAELREQKHRLAVLHTKGFITDEKYAVQERDIDSRIVTLNTEIDKANEEKDQTADYIRQLMELLTGYDGSKEYRLKVLNEAIDSISVADGTLTFNMPGGLKFTERTGEYDTP